MLIVSKFPPGQLVSTRGALDGFTTEEIEAALTRHCAGDWGDLCEEDKAENERALQEGSRLLSSYKLGARELWIITEADRSATTVLLPSEY